jgi:hypothetical protein
LAPEKSSDWVKRLLAEMGPMSDNPNIRTMQEIEFKKRYAEAKKAEEQRIERLEKQAALEHDLAQKSRLYLDHTGTTPSPSLLERWKDEYVERQARQLEALREARLAESIAENYDFTEGPAPYAPEGGE